MRLTLCRFNFTEEETRFREIEEHVLQRLLQGLCPQGTNAFPKLCCG